MGIVIVHGSELLTRLKNIYQGFRIAPEDNSSGSCKRTVYSSKL